MKSLSFNLITVTESLEMKKILASRMCSGQRNSFMPPTDPLIEKTVAALSAQGERILVAKERERERERETDRQRDRQKETERGMTDLREKIKQ